MSESPYPASRSAGRNLRKRMVRKASRQAHQDGLHLEVYSDSGWVKVRPDWAKNPPTDGNILAQIGQMYLKSHTHYLRQCATRLGGEGVWSYYRRNLPHARLLRYESEFRLLTVQFARQFAGKSVKTAYEAVS